MAALKCKIVLILSDRAHLVLLNVLCSTNEIEKKFLRCCKKEKKMLQSYFIIPGVFNAYCDGMRTQSNRQFPDGAPLILIINVEFLAASGTLASESDFPQQIKFLGRRYWYNIFISCIYLFTEYPKTI